MASGEILGASGAALLANAAIPNKFGGLSFDPARVRFVGGGGKTGLEDGSGEDLYKFAGEIREAGGDIPAAGSSVAIVDVRWFRGGEYGGGAGLISVLSLAYC